MSNLLLSVGWRYCGGRIRVTWRWPLSLRSWKAWMKPPSKPCTTREWLRSELGMLERYAVCLPGLDLLDVVP